jgi:small subunit ribosomal protein S6
VTAYEILLLLDPELPEERQAEIVSRVREQVEKGGGKWVSHDVWGRRRLEYEIDKKREGVYHLLNFDAEPATLDEVSRVLKITDGVMRHLATHRLEGGKPGPQPPPEPAMAGPAASIPSDDTDGTEEYAGSTATASSEEE